MQSAAGCRGNKRQSFRGKLKEKESLNLWEKCFLNLTEVSIPRGLLRTVPAGTDPVFLILQCHKAQQFAVLSSSRAVPRLLVREPHFKK
jgi:hypothetical protein